MSIAEAALAPTRAVGTRPVGEAFGRWAPWALAALLFLLALPPRLLDTDRFVATDELFWVGRSGNFARALIEGRLGQTFQTGHPGVTTMWTALLGMGRDRALELASDRRGVSRRDVSGSPAFLPALASARRAFGVVNALGVALVGLLTWRLFGPGPAILGGCLLAFDPFLLAHARLVHIDASLTIWMTLALLAALVRWSGGGRGVLILSGVATGLALLSKAPAAYLLAFVPLLGVAHVVLWTQRSRLATPPGAGVGDRATPTATGARLASDLALWAAATAVTYLLLWPALWVAPIETVSGVLGFVRGNANLAHAAAAGEGPGLLFYPLVLLLRATPLSLLGVVLLATWRPAGQAGRGAVALGLFALGFGLAMTFLAKNFDRYLLPIFPALDLLAGFGYWQLLARLMTQDPGRRTKQAPPASPTLRPATLGACLALAAGIVGLSSWWIAQSWPYVSTYANPLAGGPSRASALIATGWGEGLDQVAAYLNQRPNAGRLKVGMPGEIYTTVLDAQFRGQVAPAEGADAAAYDYVVVYTRNLQLGERPPFWDERFLRWPPEATVSLGGVEYAWIYNSAAGAPVGAVFGDPDSGLALLALDGYGLDSTTVQPGRALELRLRWRALAPLPAGLRLVAEFRRVDGDRSSPAQPLPLQSGDPSGWSGSEPGAAAYALAGPATPGAYVLAIRVVDDHGRALPLTRSPLLGPAAVPEIDAVALRGLQVR